ncbi:MAG TPA: chemotaxis protein CheA [Nitrospiraceae bacterium]|nr:chemotaxis protein CheA [Nitrospiraceae bacterium]
MGDALDTSSLLHDYIDDARAHLDALDDALLDLERGVDTAGIDADVVSDLLGPLHTLKGNSGMMGFVAIQQNVHELEGVFKRVIDTPALADQALLDALFENATELRNAVEQVVTEPNPDLSQATAFLESLATDRRAGGTITRRKAVAGTKVKTARTRGRRNGSPEGNAGDSQSAAPLVKSNILRVDFERLDHLLNLTGELVIHKTKLHQIAKQVEDLVGGEEFFGELPAVAQMIEKTSADLQEAIMRVRMLPIRQVFQRFPRMVRDLAKQKHKEVTLTFAGEETEIDKTVIDALGEPLLHLIRNSIDHGIEEPDVRAKNKKSRSGSIHLSAKQESNHIVITVKDDGGGMNESHIREKAIKKGVISRGQHLTQEDVFSLVFTPGFSTAAAVSETSGRGVGLDVVKKVVSDFNGIIEVTSDPGQGTEFILKMPLTLAIIPVLLVDVSGRSFAVPLSAVLESVKIHTSDIHKADGKEVVQIRDTLLPVKRLHETLGLPGNDQEINYMVVIGRAEKRMGILVGRLLGQQEIVIKALDDYLGDTVGISGATILGDGQVVLIVDTARIMAGRESEIKR